MYSTLYCTCKFTCVSTCTSPCKNILHLHVHLNMHLQANLYMQLQVHATPHAQYNSVPYIYLKQLLVIRNREVGRLREVVDTWGNQSGLSKTGRIGEFPAEERWSETEISLYVNFSTNNVLVVVNLLFIVKTRLVSTACGGGWFVRRRSQEISK